MKFLENRVSERRELTYPVTGKVKIEKFQNQNISGKSAFIQIENISLNGLRLSTPLNFPVAPELVLSIEFHLFGIENHISGSIVWKRKVNNDYTYGFKILSTNMGYVHSLLPLVEPIRS